MINFRRAREWDEHVDRVRVRPKSHDERTNVETNESEAWMDGLEGGSGYETGPCSSLYLSPFPFILPPYEGNVYPRHVAYCLL